MAGSFSRKGYQKFAPAGKPAAAAAVRQAASASIRKEPAGHALLFQAPATYAPAHDSTARAALGPAGTAAHASTRAVPREYPGVPSQCSAATYRPPVLWSTLEYSRVPVEYPLQYGRKSVRQYKRAWGAAHAHARGLRAAPAAHSPVRDAGGVP